ncbi:LysR family transcriptional regulator [Holophaga foetida]|uniref:LysR family transcriptional regulator n=1 Tax=Holophaga foetida TaxID=35839 RepID=UPI00024721A8|nr:LysR family transcriptional regulator [Holophaga foetida]
MDTQHLRCFMAVVEYMNFTKAARQLCLTPSAISYQIASLERELGVKLLERVPNAVRFTPAGQFFYNGLKGFMASYENLVTGAQRRASGATGNLAIGFLGGVEKRFLPIIVEHFRSLFPSVSLQINRFDMIPLAYALEKREVDIAFTLASGLPENTNLQTKLLLRERVVVVMQPSNPLAQRESLVLEDLKDVPCVDLVRPVGVPVHDPFVENCAKRGFKPRIVERFSDMESMFLAVASGIGITVFPKYRAEPLVSPQLTYVPLQGEGSTADCVVAWDPRTSNPVVHEFLKELDTHTWGSA